LESSRLILFLVSGAAKRDAMARARAGDQTLPAGRLRPQGEVIWLTDRAAAGA
jgi:6-phosphogluconolactonase